MPEREARLGQLLPACRVEGLGDAEVRHQRLAGGEEDVLGLDIAMNDAVAVGVVQRPRHFPGNGDRGVHRELRLPIQPVPEGFALDVGHHVVQHVARGAGVEQAEDMGVLQAGGELDFLEEAVGAERAGDLGPEHLERDLAGMLEVLREVDGRHAAATDLALDRVAVGRAGGVFRRARAVGHGFLRPDGPAYTDVLRGLLPAAQNRWL